MVAKVPPGAQRGKRDLWEPIPFVAVRVPQNSLAPSRHLCRARCVLAYSFSGLSSACCDENPHEYPSGRKGTKTLQRSMPVFAMIMSRWRRKDVGPAWQRLFDGDYLMLRNQNNGGEDSSPGLLPATAIANSMSVLIHPTVL